MRIGLDEAIHEPLLFQHAFFGGQKGQVGFTKPQQALVKAVYGLPLDEEELVVWSALNGEGIYDDLGYLQQVRSTFAYQPGEEFEDISLILGRRFAKTSISSFIIAYEALCGGHQEYLGRSSRQVPIFLQVAQDVATAKANLRQHILSALESSPIGRTELGDVQKSVTAESIRLKHSLILVGAPSIKGLRGQAVAVTAMDEVGYWPKDVEAAAPDVEIERAIIPAMVQFPFRKRIKTSSPAAKEGILWRDYELGTYGHRVGGRPEHRRLMVLRGPTAVSLNPTVTRADLAKERAKDELAFRREFLAEFQDSTTGFLNPDLLRQAIDKGITRRPPVAGILYTATIDPGFRRDAFVLSIGHTEGGNFLLDLVESWRGTPTAPLSPTIIMAYVAGRCAEYGVRLVYSDQYHLESLQELAEQHRLTLSPSPLTAQLKKKMWGDFILLLQQHRLRLLDHHDLLDECLKLERTLSAHGVVHIGGTRDDHAMAVALCLHHALPLGEALHAPPASPSQTHADLFWAARRRQHETAGTPWWA